MNTNRYGWLLLIILSATRPAFSADSGGHDHHFHHNDIGVFIGGTTPLNEDAGGKTAFTIGVDYERRFSPSLGAILMLEHVDDEHKRQDIIAGLFAYRFASFRIGLGPGIEFVEKDLPAGGTKTSDYLLIVTRLIYEFHVGKFTLAPSAGVDFIGETKTNLIYGLTWGYGF